MTKSDKEYKSGNTDEQEKESESEDIKYVNSTNVLPVFTSRNQDELNTLFNYGGVTHL